MLDEWVPSKKKCILIPSGTHDDPDRHHLFVILTEACEQGFHLAVSLSSVKAGVKHDPTCVLDAGCHDFVTAQSFVMYGKIEKLRSAHISKCVAGWTYKPRGEMPDEQFTRICDGVEASDFTPGWARHYFKKNA
ncbi:hypothetical protein RPMA_10895 [Tardiphaga alba]|uniref:Uncharacterized protein n=1 Tax=Tardiphaga alba TaxID=340268 RepID=A0ABX8A6B6_9BRAD|nr:hypothetical protein [Tardiphaga alba]QUS39286.1 hypothetical protein RPMA_10895 [Tardiphaga alba]